MANKERLGFNVVLIGMITAGKDTQSKILREKYSFRPIETGKFSRLLLKEKSPTGDLFRKVSGNGKPAPVKFIKEFLTREIDKKKKNEDLLFIGGPRLKPEAQLLKKILSEKKQDFLAFYISLPDREVYRRSLERKHGNGDDLFKILDEKKLIAARIKWHKEQVSKTVKYFKDLKKIKVINGDQSVEKVAKIINDEILRYKEKSRIK